MQGPIENALMMVCAGNAFLRGADIKGFWPEAPTFRFMKTCEFRAPPATDGDDYPLVAGDPMAWFGSLKPWCRGLRLHYSERQLEPGQMPGIEPRILVGFVGGGPRWLVEAVGPENSEAWEGFDRIGDREDRQQKIWEKTYIRVGTATPEQVSPVSLEDGLKALRGVLPEIEAYAREERHDNFAECFARARDALDGPAPEPNDYFDSFRRFTGVGEPQVRALSAVMDAWVFGGMGSWNDIGGSGERYDALSQRLFDSLCDTTSGIGNSTYHGS